MKTIKRIICPVDVYEFQPEAAEYAMALANAFDAKITVVYVLEAVPSRYYVEGRPLLTALAGEDTVKKRAEAELAELLSNCFNVRVDKGEVLRGDAADKILQIAEECSGDLIVMASHCRSLVCRAVHGSVTSKVLANTKIPVVVV